MNDLWIYLGWTLLLFTFAVIGFFGVRNARRAYGAVIAGIVGAVLVVSGVFSFLGLAAVWSGYPVDDHMSVSWFTLTGLVTAFFNAQTWLGHVG